MLYCCIQVYTYSITKKVLKILCGTKKSQKYINTLQILVLNLYPKYTVLDLQLALLTLLIIFSKFVFLGFSFFSLCKNTKIAYQRTHFRQVSADNQRYLFVEHYLAGSSGRKR